MSSLTITSIGLAGRYALSYAPPPAAYTMIPRSTSASDLLNIGGLAVLIGGPAIVGRLVCAIGRLSADYEAGCGSTIGFAYVGLILVPVVALLTRHQEPAQGDLDFLGPTYSYSSTAMLIAYIGGVALGATIGWNCYKARKGEDMTLLPISRAGPPPAEVADWIEPILRTSTRGAAGVRALDVPLLAFAF